METKKANLNRQSHEKFVKVISEVYLNITKLWPWKILICDKSSIYTFHCCLLLINYVHQIIVISVKSLRKNDKTICCGELEHQLSGRQDFWLRWAPDFSHSQKPSKICNTFRSANKKLGRMAIQMNDLHNHLWLSNRQLMHFLLVSIQLCQIESPWVRGDILICND